MATIKELFSSANQAITITLASLANGSARQSTAIDNSSNLYLDAPTMFKLKSGASSVSSVGIASIYAYGSVDGGTTYSDGASGSDGAITLTSPPNVKLIGTVNMVANATTYIGGPFSVAAAFGNILPAFWGIIVVNSTGAAFDGTGGNFSVFYQGVYAQN